MSKEIREIPYHLYLGCEVSVTNIEGRYTTIIDYDFFQRFYDEDDNRFMNDPKPILRKLSSMRDDDRKEIFELVFKRKFVGDNITRRDEGKKEARWVLWSGLDRLFLYDDGDVGADCDLQHFRVHMPTIVKHLLSKGFDLFGLIEKGLALDSDSKQ
jgi:hypothetical protein